jgi:DNA-binding MarR family transcriptional regulator
MIRVGVDAYVIDSLMRELVGRDRKPSAFLVYLHLWRRSGGGRVRWVPASHQSVARGTGLSKSAVQAAVKILLRRKLVRSSRDSPTGVPRYEVRRPWGGG